MTILKYTLGAIFLLAGSVKVFKAKPIVEQFEEFGLPNYFIVVVGVLEILGATALLFVPSLSLYAAIGLVLLMIGAVANHLKVKHPIEKTAPSLILGILTIVFLLFSFEII